MIISVHTKPQSCQLEEYFDPATLTCKRELEIKESKKTLFWNSPRLESTIMDRTFLPAFDSFIYKDKDGSFSSSLVYYNLFGWAQL